MGLNNKVWVAIWGDGSKVHARMEDKGPTHTKKIEVCQFVLIRSRRVGGGDVSVR